MMATFHGAIPESLWCQLHAENQMATNFVDFINQSTAFLSPTGPGFSWYKANKGSFASSKIRASEFW